MRTHRAIYLFRCGETGLYALSHDRSGGSLPSSVCANRWRFEREIDITAGNRARYKPILADIVRQGFHLIHAAFAAAEFNLPGACFAMSQADQGVAEARL
jgi:hypothetical protein